MKNFKFYIGAFISLLSIGTVCSTVLSALVAIPVCVASGNNIFWWLFIPLEIKSVCDSLYLTFTTKKDPWSKE